MSALNLSLGQATDAGTKPDNEDHFGAIIPTDTLLENKGFAIAIADGMSGADGGKEASQMSVRMFLDDYFSTPETWTVKSSVTKVMASLNSWLFSQSQQYTSRHGMVTTFSAMVVKSRTAHLFHIGDSRIYRLRGKDFEQLTQDHRQWVNQNKSSLRRALGIDTNLNIDYRSVSVEPGDVFFLSTDGIHDFISNEAIHALIEPLSSGSTPLDDPALNACCKTVIQAALGANSNDNLTCQLLQINQLDEASQSEVYEKLSRLPFPPELSPGVVLDGYRILRELHASSHSQVYLAEDTLSGAEDMPQKVVIKTPSVNYEDDHAYIDLFLQEEWIGKRLASPYLMKVCARHHRKRQFLYTVMEYIRGQTLEQWMQDTPEPGLAVVRDIVEQIAQGLRAMHRLEIVHQDLKPGNILIGVENHITIIDFGSAKVLGLSETQSVIEHTQIAGTASYSAPEYFKGEPGSNRSDLYSLGVITYEMLSGKLPYGEVNPLRASRKRFRYVPLRQYSPTVPDWVDACIQRAVHPSPKHRYPLLSEFIADLKKPNKGLLQQRARPLVESNPIRTFQTIALIELLIIIGLLIQMMA